MTLGALRSPGKPVVLLFTDPKCGPCNQLMPDVAEWQRSDTERTYALVSRGKADDNVVKAEEHGIGNVLLQKDFETAEAYRYQGTPSAVIVNADGTIGSELVAGPANIRGLINTGAGSAPTGAVAPVRQNAPQLLPVGNPAPNFELRDLQEGRVQLADFRGRDTVLLFWNPSCGFCKKMLDDLKRWETTRGEDAPVLLVVSQGSRDDVLAQGFKSTVLLDNGAIPGLFGATGTPVAILIDSEGRVASVPAIGAQAVLELAGATSLSA